MSAAVASRASARQQASTGTGAVAAWLYLCAAMVFAMAVIGAITRLTESGLSIMEWNPIGGAIPPLSRAEWERLFALYRETEQYRLTNAGMSLGDFQNIFWWEFVHRLWGRLIGLVYALPLAFFWWRGLVPARLKGQLLGLLVLGGLQGAVGWFMVASGFGDRVEVSQYRLAIHLAIAVAIYGWLLYLAIGLTDRTPPASPADRPLRLAFRLLLGLLAVTILAGAFVAGTNAGFTYNTFPLMDGRLVPAGYGQLQPWLLNVFENVTAIQFNHRLLATLTVCGAWAAALWSFYRSESGAVRGAALLVAGAASLQFLLGVAALLAVVPTWLGALHQAGALVLLGCLLLCLHRLRPGRAAR